MLMLKCCFTSTETLCLGLLGTEAQDGHLAFHNSSYYSILLLLSKYEIVPVFCIKNSTSVIFNSLEVSFTAK